jgi:hypothetical protein
MTRLVNYWAVVMNDVSEGIPISHQVRFEVNCRVLAEYAWQRIFLTLEPRGSGLSPA